MNWPSDNDDNDGFEMNLDDYRSGVNLPQQFILDEDKEDALRSISSRIWRHVDWIYATGAGADLVVIRAMLQHLCGQDVPTDLIEYYLAKNTTRLAALGETMRQHQIEQLPSELDLTNRLYLQAAILLEAYMVQMLKGKEKMTCTKVTNLVRTVTNIATSLRKMDPGLVAPADQIPGQAPTTDNPQVIEYNADKGGLASQQADALEQQSQELQDNMQHKEEEDDN